jgi:hypothetical protein
MRRTGRVALVWATVLGACGVPNSARAKDTLKEELAVVANELAQALKERDQAAVAVGQFTSPPQLVASAGAGIEKLLADELQRLGIAVNRRAKFGITGKYVFLESGARGVKSPTARIIGELVDPSGQALFAFSREFRDAPTLSTLFGVTVELPPDWSERDRIQALQERLEKPRTDVRGTRVSAGRASRYALEVWVEAGGQKESGMERSAR